MENYRRILNRVGTVLILVGTVDIGYMFYCIANKISYGSSFNIFAVVGGIFLVRGSLRVTRVVTVFSAFYSAGFLGLLLIFPIIQPFDLWRAQFKLGPIQTSLLVLFSILIVVFCFWVYFQLTARAVMEARDAVGLGNRPPRWGFYLGAAFVLTLAVIIWPMLHGESAQTAITRAREQLGQEYQYHVSRISGSSATVIAYNDNEIRTIDVNW